VERSSPSRLLAATAGAAVAFVGALAVMSLFAGFSSVGASLHAHRGYWFVIAFAAETLSFAGYVLAYRSVAEVEGGPRLTIGEATELVAVGFGAFLARGGAALDSKALRPHGAGDREGEVRVLALDALEHAPLAPATCLAAIVLLAEGSRKPPLDFTVPWATLVPIGAALAFVGVRHRARFAGKKGLRGKLGDALNGIDLLFQLALDWRRHWPGFVGASLYWAGDVLCLWASLQPFDAAPPFPAVVVAHAVGYVLSRRTLPLAGAGVVEVLMPLTLVAAGAPFAGAILGVAVYRVFNLWLPLVPAIAALPHLRRRFGSSFGLMPERAKG